MSGWHKRIQSETNKMINQANIHYEKHYEKNVFACKISLFCIWPIKFKFHICIYPPFDAIFQMATAHAVLKTPAVDAMTGSDTATFWCYFCGREDRLHEMEGHTRLIHGGLVHHLTRYNLTQISELIGPITDDYLIARSLRPTSGAFFGYWLRLIEIRASMSNFWKWIPSIVFCGM